MYHRYAVATQAFRKLFTYRNHVFIVVAGAPLAAFLVFILIRLQIRFGGMGVVYEYLRLLPLEAHHWRFSGYDFYLYICVLRRGGALGLGRGRGLTAAAVYVRELHKKQRVVYAAAVFIVSRKVQPIQPEAEQKHHEGGRIDSFVPVVNSFLSHM